MLKNKLCSRGHDLDKTRKFHPNGDSYCAACKKFRYDKFRKEHPHKIAIYSRRANLKRLYGLGQKEFDALLLTQNNTCALCHTDVPGARGWCVDHDHTTKEVRGILCHYCNTGIGLLKEDVNLLQRAIVYLSKAGRSNKGKNKHGKK
jgi:hypothetical protein